MSSVSYRKQLDVNSKVGSPETFLIQPHTKKWEVTIFIQIPATLEMITRHYLKAVSVHDEET